MANTETVEIIIEGTDKSAAAFASAGTKLQGFGKSSKDVGSALGKLARLAGLGEFANVAGDIKNSGEAVFDLTKNLKGGGLAATALKAGLVGLAGAAVFKLSDGIARWAMDIDGLVKKAESARAELAAGGDKYRTGLDADLEARREIAKLTNDEAAAYSKISAEMAKQQSEVDRLKANKEKLATPSLVEKLPMTTFKEQREGSFQTAEALYQNELATLQVYQKQLAAMNDMTPVQKQLADLKAEETAKKQRLQSEQEYWKLIAEQEEAAVKRSEETRKSFEETNKVLDDMFAAQEDKDWAVIDNLRLAQTELVNGESAALRMSLAMQGISDPAIEAAVALTEQNKALEEQKKLKEELTSSAEGIMQQMIEEQGKAAPTLQAKESRFLTRGTAGGSDSSKIAKNTEEMKKIAAAALAEAKEQKQAAIDLKNAMDIAYAEVS